MDRTGEQTLERRAAQARRMAHSGDVARAVEQFAELLPRAAERLEPERLLRFLGLYWDALRRRRQAVEVERLLCLAEAQRIVCERLGAGGPRGRIALRRHRRNLERGLLTLLAEARRIGVDSAPGQVCLRLAFVLLDALRSPAGQISPTTDGQSSRRLALRIQPGAVDHAREDHANENRRTTGDATIPRIRPRRAVDASGSGLFVVERTEQRYRLLQLAA